IRDRSIGDGSIIGGVHKGCRELYNAGWVDKIPRLIGVQSTGSNAIAHAWENDLSPVEMTSRPANTIADSISSRLPRDRAKALRAVRETHGAVVQVDDTDILAAIPRLALQTGIFAEPAAAATFAGLNHALSAGYIHPADHVLLLITGNGLKDVQGAMQAVHDQQVPATSPTLEAVRRQVEQWDRNA
ncbi:MAG: pyridoxal-phosphate dependent enzyme, partial [Chloroflexi bacterium]|nr:pyridoxal-phosphate dependent enzyme [Chloroflexota bacterium]